MQMHYAPVGLKYQEFIVSPVLKETLNYSDNPPPICECEQCLCSLGRDPSSGSPHIVTMSHWSRQIAGEAGRKLSGHPQLDTTNERRLEKSEENRGEQDNAQCACQRTPFNNN